MNQCSVIVWDDNEFDIHPIGHCRLDGKWCETEGDFTNCRYNWPIKERGDTNDTIQ